MTGFIKDLISFAAIVSFGIAIAGASVAVTTPVPV